MKLSSDATIAWLTLRVRILCILVLIVGSLLPPYIPKAALAPYEAATSSQQFLMVEEGFILKSSSLTKQGTRRAYAEGIFHTVKDGESYERIADQYNITVDTILWANDLERETSLQPGNELLILPVDGVLHTVKRGQNLLRIAQLYGVESTEISAQNNIEGGFIMAGQELIIPGGTPVVNPPPTLVATVEPEPDPEPTPAPGPSEPDTPPSTPDPAPSAPTTRTYTPTPTAGVLQKPCSEACFITQYYHGSHFALDMQERGGGPIYASEAGTVTRADYGWNGGYGNVLEVDHGNGLVTLYAHNKKLLVTEGDTVKRGQKIADMGNTGLVYGATGIHVHYEVRVHGVKKNPLLYIQ